MELYILKSGVCLAIFYGFYKLLLEKASFHNFKRFYLLAALVLAFGIPFITFIEYVEPVPMAPVQEFTVYETQIPAIDEAPKTNYIPTLLWTAYFSGVLFFGFMFFKNLLGLVGKIKRNPKLKSKSFINVLLNDLVIPHTFFSYIFLNKHKFETQQIPKEVLLHEETHAKEKHSLDILLIELLQIFFWFNPFIYLIKHSIKLNHEFLADRAVLKQGIASSTYQNILLAFSSPDPDSYRDYRGASEPQLANAINYSSIKKRFTVMKKHTTKKALWLRSLILLPLLAVLIYSFSEKKVVEKPQIYQIANGETKVHISKDKKVTIGKETFDFNSLSEKLIELTKNEEIKPFVYIEVEGHVNSEYLETIKNEILKSNLSVSTIRANSLYFNENTYDEMKRHFENIQYTADTLTLTKKNGEMIKGISGPQIIADTVKAKLKSKEDVDYDIITLKVPRSKNHVMSSNDLKSLNKYVQETYYNDNNQQKATPEEIEEYNTLVKQFNSNKEGERIIKVKDKNRIESIYEKMNAEQKQENATFPDFSTIAPPPQPYQQKATPTNSQNKYEKDYLKYINERNKTISFLEKHKVDLPYGYLELNESEQKEFDSLYSSMYSAYRKLTEEDKKSAPKILPPPPDPKQYKLENGKLIKKEYGSTNQQKATQNIVEEYKKKYNELEVLKKTPPHYVFKTETEKEQIDHLFSDLGGMYFRMTKANKQRVSRPITPILPYVKLVRDGKVEYKKRSELTEEDKKLLPPPPPPPVPIMPQNPSKELLKAKKEFEEKGNAYGRATQAAIKEGKGNFTHLKTQYDEVMELYNAFRELAEKENVKTPPPPPPPPAKK
ncbi:M56 family metallopeptidase [Flavobacteriaceae bacterium XHP0103]|uniref:M56 family metallopeptidase n=1 Tax=Marixanthotalea marina TaxID=2844359 RepID=UPI00298A019D|nr:M56 family metallopeptidase [Marixanthotalea marina]MBU3820952.1 M56 family metallopeptidase [Marixanthotalea marina]